METLPKCLQFISLIAGLSQYDKWFIPSFARLTMTSGMSLPKSPCEIRDHFLYYLIRLLSILFPTILFSRNSNRLKKR